MVLLSSVHGGAERTANEYAALFEEAGLSLTRVVPAGPTVSVIEAVPTAAAVDGGGAR
jgi:hypothetical protein